MGFVYRPPAAHVGHCSAVVRQVLKVTLLPFDDARGHLFKRRRFVTTSASTQPSALTKPAASTTAPDSKEKEDSKKQVFDYRTLRLLVAIIAIALPILVLIILWG